MKENNKSNETKRGIMQFCLCVGIIIMIWGNLSLFNWENTNPFFMAIIVLITGVMGIDFYVLLGGKLNKELLKLKQAEKK